MGVYAARRTPLGNARSPQFPIVHMRKRDFFYAAVRLSFSSRAGPLCATQRVLDLKKTGVRLAPS